MNHCYIDMRHSFLQYYLQQHLNKHEYELRQRWLGKRCHVKNCEDNSEEMFVKDDFFKYFKQDGMKQRAELAYFFK